MSGPHAPPAGAARGRRWAAALAEHERAVRAFAERASHVDDAAWAREPAPGRWSPALVALHLCQSYEVARDSAHGGGGMRRRVSSGRAFLYRALLLPLILRSSRFPRGVPAPREIRPDPGEATQVARGELLSRLGRSADAAAEALASAPRAVRFTHAYFGELAPLQALRLLSAHTRHHTRTLAGAAR